MKTNKNVGFTMKIISTTIIFIGTAGCADITDQLRPFPPTKLLWIRPGSNKREVHSELVDCSAPLRLEREMTYEQMESIVDVCMLKKGFTFVPRPQNWRNVCNSSLYSETVGCKSSRGEIFITPDKATIPNRTFNQPEVNNKTIDCRESSPDYEKAYCECQSGRRYSVKDPCEYLLKGKYDN